MMELSKLPKISDAEWQVMKVLWNKAPLTSSEIIEQLSDDTSWSPKTIHTLLSRLTAKKALEVDKTHTPYLYRPLVTQEECRKEETKFFLEKVYDGSLKMLLANFVDDHKLSPEEIEELKRILD